MEQPVLPDQALVAVPSQTVAVVGVEVLVLLAVMVVPEEVLVLVAAAAARLAVVITEGTEVLVVAEVFIHYPLFLLMLGCLEVKVVAVAAVEEEAPPGPVETEARRVADRLVLPSPSQVKVMVQEVMAVAVVLVVMQVVTHPVVAGLVATAATAAEQQDFV
tara:strand:- start:9 stop:491 length:483 start_codon:yes stop_codon:yes gene_type:complete